jgi:hypothetical protein
MRLMSMSMWLPMHDMGESSLMFKTESFEQARCAAHANVLSAPRVCTYEDLSVYEYSYIKDVFSSTNCPIEPSAPQRNPVARARR